MEKSPRWLQRFQNYKRALISLESACTITEGKPTELERDGIIQRFELTFELAWKVLKDFMEHKGFQNLRSPADVRQEAFRVGYISDGIGWSRMQQGRNESSHEYDEPKIEKLYRDVTTSFLPILLELLNLLSKEEEFIKLKFGSIPGLDNIYSEQLLHTLVIAKVTKVVLFGSRATGTFKPGSDIDLAIYGNIDAEEFSRLEITVSDLALPWKVDLLHAAQISNKALMTEIDKDGVVLFEIEYK